MPPPVSVLPLQERQGQLQLWATAFGTLQRVAAALRCRILLAAARDKSDNAIAQELETNDRDFMAGCFARRGLNSLWESAPGRSRKRTYTAEKIQGAK